MLVRIINFFFIICVLRCMMHLACRVVLFSACQLHRSTIPFCNATCRLRNLLFSRPIILPRGFYALHQNKFVCVIAFFINLRTYRLKNRSANSYSMHRINWHKNFFAIHDWFYFIKHTNPLIHHNNLYTYSFIYRLNPRMSHRMRQPKWIIPTAYISGALSIETNKKKTPALRILGILVCSHGRVNFSPIIIITPRQRSAPRRHAKLY